MELKDVKRGEIYKCRLSDREMLVVSTKKTIEGKEGEDDVIETVLAGKYVVEQNGVKSYAYDELYDGQLEKLKN